MFTAILIIAILIAAFLGYASMRPNTFSLSRNLDINAAPEKIFAQINDFRNWADWSPWDKIDPNMQRNYSGAPSGVGARYAWIGSKQVGEGNMEITKSVPSSSIVLDLNFLKPFKASNVTEFTLTPKGSSTNVKWEMRGSLNLMMKVMHLFMNMDKMVGKDFEKGLGAIKAITEK